MLYCKAAQEFWATNLVNLNHDQATRTTPEVEPPPPPNFDTSPTLGRLSFEIFNVNLPLYTAGLQQYKARAHDSASSSPLP
ncbi:hypothetical protein TNCV_4428981 [Trichonephila clavipes]|nr:hypothetical protein TNCV_4428981 [Trichonephila clavipes]